MMQRLELLRFQIFVTQASAANSDPGAPIGVADLEDVGDNAALFNGRASKPRAALCKPRSPYEAK